MIYLILLIMIAVLLIRFYLLKKEIKNVTQQLNELNRSVTEKKIDMSFIDRDFEKLVAEINNQIDRTKQAKAEKKSTENELKRAISYISHDIRTPMTSILGYVQLLEGEHVTPEMRKECTTIIKTSAKRLKVLLEDFFELSIIEQADYPILMERIKLNQLLSEVVVGLYEAFNERQLKPVMNLLHEEVVIIGDSSAVKRVIENLLVNAIKYSEGDISIELEHFNNTVQVIISNPTTQLSELELNHMFDRFYKADQTRAGKGTGLGLSIAKSLMEKMNGSLTAELHGNQLLMKCVWFCSKAKNETVSE